MSIPILNDRDKRIDFRGEYKYLIPTGAKVISYQQYNADTFSNSQLTWNVNTNSPEYPFDCQVLIKYDITATFTGTGNPLLGGSSSSLNLGTDAFRFMPLQSSCNSMSASFNDSVSFNQLTNHHLSALVRSHYNQQLWKEWSLAPSALDNAPQYSSLFGSVNNPLNNYANSETFTQGRACQEMTVTNGNGTATVRATIVEPIFMSPFADAYGKNKTSFYKINKLSFIMQLADTWANGNTVWSHDATNGNTISAISVAFNSAPELLFTYFTLPEDVRLSMPPMINYPYHRIQEYQQGNLSAILSGSSSQININNIQLGSIPEKILIYGVDSQKTFSSSDVFLNISQVQIQYANQTSLLNTASEEQLWKLSRDNGYSGSYIEWHQSNNFGCGSVLTITPKDLGFTEDLFSNMNVKNQNFQVQVTLNNNSSGSITPYVYVIFLFPGVMQVNKDDLHVTQTEILSNPQMLANAPLVPETRSQGMMYGDGLVGSGYSPNQFVKDLGDFFHGFKKGFNLVKENVADPIFGMAKGALPLLGLGMTAGGMSGGKRMSRAQLRNRGRVMPDYSDVY